MIDSVFIPALDIHTPSLAITSDGVVQAIYHRIIEQNTLLWPVWPKDIMYSESKNWVDWTAPQQITESHHGQYGPQVWPNLYWQPNTPAKKGFLAVWDGKEEKSDLQGQPWFARSFASSDLTF